MTQRQLKVRYRLRQVPESDCSVHVLTGVAVQGNAAICFLLATTQAQNRTRS